MRSIISAGMSAKEGEATTPILSASWRDTIRSSVCACVCVSLFFSALFSLILLSPLPLGRLFFEFFMAVFALGLGSLQLLACVDVGCSPNGQRGSEKRRAGRARPEQIFLFGLTRDWHSLRLPLIWAAKENKWRREKEEEQKRQVLQDGEPRRRSCCLCDALFASRLVFAPKTRGSTKRPKAAEKGTTVAWPIVSKALSYLL